MPTMPHLPRPLSTARQVAILRDAYRMGLLTDQQLARRVRCLAMRHRSPHHSKAEIYVILYRHTVKPVSPAIGHHTPGLSVA